MFEKNAEEYSAGKGHEHYNYLFEEHAGSPADFARWCFQDGAEFGYQEGLKAKINATTISDCPIKDEQGDKEEQLEYAKTIIQDLLDNSDEYARQRSMDFLEEKK